MVRSYRHIKEYEVLRQHEFDGLMEGSAYFEGSRIPYTDKPDRLRYSSTVFHF